MKRIAALAAVAALAGPAAAHPGRSERADPDLAAEAKSELWNELVHPGTAAGRSRLDDAVRLLRLNTGDLVSAIELLDAITRDQPEQTDAWGYLAIAAENLRRWPLCATAYAAVWRRDPAWRPTRVLDQRPTRLRGLQRALPVSIAFCQGRAGDLAGAAATLGAAIARGETGAELWLRTGEIAMAQGRLDDAIAALERAGGEGGARWLLAMAADRARRDDDAEAAAEVAGRYDARAGTAGWTLVPLQPGDNDYLLGFAELSSGRPEFARAYFRRFLLAAPATSPWRARALAHLDVLAKVDLIDRITIEGDATARPAIVAAVRRVLPAITACMAPVPTRVEEVAIAVTPVIELKPMPDVMDPFARRRAPARPPKLPRLSSPSVTVSPQPLPVRAEDDLEAVEQARACVERIAATIHLPPVPIGGWRIRFPAIAR